MTYYIFDKNVHLEHLNNTLKTLGVTVTNFNELQYKTKGYLKTTDKNHKLIGFYLNELGDEYKYLCLSLIPYNSSFYSHLVDCFISSKEIVDNFFAELKNETKSSKSKLKADTSYVQTQLEFNFETIEKQVKNNNLDYSLVAKNLNEFNKYFTHSTFYTHVLEFKIHFLNSFLKARLAYV